MNQSRTYIYRGGFPLAGLLVLPALLLLLTSVAAVLLVGGIVGSILLPLFFGRSRGGGGGDDGRTITLERNDYRAVSTPSELPPSDRDHAVG